MKYMGSKNRHAKELLPIILKNRKEGQCYVEAFVGGANMIDKVDGWRIGADSHEHLIAMLKFLEAGGTFSNELSEDRYNDIKNNKNMYRKELVGFAGFPCSYGAKWFGGYCRGKTDKGDPRDYIAEAWRNVEKQKPSLFGIKFIHQDYKFLDIPGDSIIYCDPPYCGATEYKDKFDHTYFWQWCRDKVSEGHQVFVSEYNAPDDFVCVWQKEVNNSLTKNTGAKKGIEKLFVHESQYEGDK